MSSVMSQLRSRLANPVIDISLATKISAMPVAFFDIHQDIEPMFTGTEPRFMADMYSRLAWHCDTSIANRLKLVAVKLKVNGELPSIDRFAELEAAIEEMFQAELNAHEVGFEAAGPLHLLVEQLNVREAWHGHAQTAMMEVNRQYVANSIQTTIGTPRRQEVSPQYKANAIVDALGIAGLLTNAQARLEVGRGINWMVEIESIDDKMRTYDSSMQSEQIHVMMEGLGDKPRDASKRAQDEFTWLTRRKELYSFLNNLSDKVKLALECYEKDVNDQRTLLDKYYQDDLDRIPVMMFVYDFCQRKLLAPGEHALTFHTLSDQIQVDACDQAMKALHITLDRFKNKPSYLYNSYKNVVAEADKLLRRVIDTRLDKNSD